MSIILVSEVAKRCGYHFVFTCRSTVHASTIPPNAQPNLVLYENRQMIEQAANNDRVTDANLGNPSKVSRPPPRIPGGIKLPC